MAATMENSRASPADISEVRIFCETDKVVELDDYLSRHVGDINLAFGDSYGNTLLHLAVKSGSLECAKMLLNRGVDINVKDMDMNTPLHFAAKLKSSHCLEYLLKSGAEVCERNTSRNTPLHFAAQAACAESVKLLVEYISRSNSHDVEIEVNSTNSNERTPLHLAAQSGSLECIKLLVENKSTVSTGDEIGNTPLHYAAMSGFVDSVKYLIVSGTNLLVTNNEKHTALYMILNNVPQGEDLLGEILNESIELHLMGDGKEELRVCMRVLCPKTKNKMAVANRLYAHHRQNRTLLLHPVLQTLIHLEWEECKYVIWYRFSVYLLYLVILTIFVSSPPDSLLSTMMRVLVSFLSVHVALFCVPYLLPGRYSWYRRITKTLLTIVPPALTLVTVSIPYNPEWYGISILLSWLSIPLYSSAIYLISHQTGMFIFVTREIFTHSLVLLFVLVGFSLTFFVLYYEENDNSSNNFWYTFLYTTLVLLQGGGSEDLKTISENRTADTTDDDGYLTYVTEALSGMRFASIITSLLFLLIVIIALLNMLVALAIKGGDELRDYGKVYHLWSQSELLYEWHEVKRYFRRAHTAKMYEQFYGKEYVTIGHRDVPMSLRNELSVVAKYKNKMGKHKLTTSAMMKEILALLYEVKGLKHE
jgi:hypothetical protein